MHTHALLTYKVRNLLHSLLLGAGMVALCAGLAYLLLGFEAMFWLGGAAALGMLFSPRISAHALLRFHKGRPIARQEMPELHAMADELARRAGLDRTPLLAYVPDPTPNAFAMGHGDQSGVALTHGLISQLTLRELGGVLAHEFSHIMHQDTRVMVMADVAGRMTAGLALFGQLLLLINLPLLLHAQMLPLLPILLLMGAPLLSALLQTALSRAREFEADRSAAELSGDPAGLASALSRMQHDRAGLLSRLFYPGRRQGQPSALRTHPETEERVRRLMEFAQESSLHTPIWQIANAIRSTVRPPQSRTTRPSQWHIPPRQGRIPRGSGLGWPFL